MAPYHRQTDKFFDNIYGGIWFFLSVTFATSLLALLTGGCYNRQTVHCVKIQTLGGGQNEIPKDGTKKTFGKTYA